MGSSRHLPIWFCGYPQSCNGMTLEAELALLEDAYVKLITGGASSYSISGRSITKHDIRWVSERIDFLRREIARNASSSSPFVATRFVNG